MKFSRCFIQCGKHYFQFSIRTSTESATSINELVFLPYILMLAFVLLSFRRILNLALHKLASDSFFVDFCC